MNGAKKEKRYICIAKVSAEKFVRYHVNDLIRFTDFLDEKFSGWRWFNVYSKKTGEQLKNFTKRNRPAGRFL